MRDQPLQNVHVTVGGGGLEGRGRAPFFAVEEQPAHHLFMFGVPAAGSGNGGDGHKRGRSNGRTNGRKMDEGKYSNDDGLSFPARRRADPRREEMDPSRVSRDGRTAVFGHRARTRLKLNAWYFDENTKTSATHRTALVPRQRVECWVRSASGEFSNTHLLPYISPLGVHCRLRHPPPPSRRPPGIGLSLHPGKGEMRPARFLPLRPRLLLPRFPFLPPLGDVGAL